VVCKAEPTYNNISFITFRGSDVSAVASPVESKVSVEKKIEGS